MSKKIKAIIFDADGVIFIGQMFSVYLDQHYGISTKMTKSFFENEFQDCLVGRSDLKKTITPYLKPWGWQQSVDKLLKLWFTTEHKPDFKLIKQIKKIKTKGIPCYLATNQEHYRTQFIKNSPEIKGLFNHTFSSAQLRCKKPKLKFFRTVFQAIKKDIPSIKKDQIIFFDDTKKIITAAKNFGFIAYHYQSFNQFKTILNKHNLSMLIK